MKPTDKINRRQALAAGSRRRGGYVSAPRHVWGGPGQKPPSERLNIAGIGVGGRGATVVRQVAEQQEKLVALCDVDAKYAARTFKVSPKPRLRKTTACCWRNARTWTPW